jgi:hypothetical protein
MKAHNLLYKQLCDPRSLMAAWAQVRLEVAAIGVTQKIVGRYERNLPRNLFNLARQLEDGSYHIAVSNGFDHNGISVEPHLHAIKIIEDAITQLAVFNLLNPFFESAFLDCNAGSQTDQSDRLIAERILEHLDSGDAYVAKAEIADCYGSLDPEILGCLLGAKVKDDSLIDLIMVWIENGCLIPEINSKLSHTGRRERLSSAPIDAPLKAIRGDFTRNSLNRHTGHRQNNSPWPRSGADGFDRADQKHTRDQMLKRLCRDAALLGLAPLVTWLYSMRTRRSLSPAMLALINAAVVAGANSPAIARYVRELFSEQVSCVQTASFNPLQQLLVNVMLHELDVAMTEADVHFVRYNDTFVITASREEQAREALGLAKRELSVLKLRLNPHKTQISRLDDETEVLGFCFHENNVAASSLWEDETTDGFLLENMTLDEWWRQGLSDFKQFNIQAVVEEFGERAKQQLSKGINLIKSKIRIS